ncbi:MAG: Rpn family recombination-promoting nuclease/putative transposase [Treponema sp.]|nr:Rpn family recombination-promoting nuclease/putative transposase [Treponema sp.]
MDDTDDVIDICLDNVFKAVFTKDTPESQGALSGLLSSIIDRDVTVLTIAANEPPIDNTRDRQIRFDINCKATPGGELMNVEMFLSPDQCEPARLEFYMGKLFTGQDIRGEDKSYDDLKMAYQISFLVKKRLFNDDEFFHIFEYYDTKREVALGGRSRIITVELEKVEKALEKPTGEMSGKERWGVFFRYAKDREKREQINEILRYEEGIAMAGEVLMTISRDEVERARLMSEYKYAVDLQSRMVTARRQGERDGIAKVARKMKAQGIPVGQIAELTGIPPEDIAKL